METGNTEGISYIYLAIQRIIFGFKCHEFIQRLPVRLCQADRTGVCCESDLPALSTEVIDCIQDAGSGFLDSTVIIFLA